MKIKAFYRSGRPTFSFEFFPPKTEDGESKLFETVRTLRALGPSFVSVTYGAMGTTRANTIQIVERIKGELGVEAAAHLTCIAHTQDEIEAVLKDLHEKGVENIVALRGDKPQDQTDFKSPKGGFTYATELVKFIRRHPTYGNAFSLAVAGYPEGHLDCPDKEADLGHLKEKVDAGADVIITQLFFDNYAFFDFLERTRKLGITQPMVPGIMPLTNGAQMTRFASMCGATIPDEMKKKIEAYGDDQASVSAYGIDYATRQCQELLAAGVPGIHFYTLNKSRATSEIYKNLGLAKKPSG